MSSFDNLFGPIATKYRNNRLGFVTEVLQATPEAWQADVLTAANDHRRIAIRSGHGVGKSCLLSWLVLHQHVTAFPAKTGSTAPSEHQLEDILWAEIGTWYRRLPELYQQVFNLTHLRLEVKGAPDESFAVGRVARPEKPEAFQGLHSPSMLLIGDEASGIAEPIFEAGIGTMSTPGARMILTGNPTRPNGFFYECFHRNRERWLTRRVSSEEVPRARGHIEDVIGTYGRDSNAYRIRVLGDFPTTADEQVISLDLIEAACRRDVKPPTDMRVVWGLDVARFGDDRSALAKRRGNVLLEPVKAWRNKDTMQTASLVLAEYKDTLEIDQPSEILVDVIGIGAGVCDRLSQLGLPARGINVGESPSANDRYMRLRDELWFKGRQWFEARDCAMPKDDALIAELIAPSYSFTASEKIVVERKVDLKARGLPSPDLADAFILTLAGGLDRIPEQEREPRGYGRRRHGDDEPSWMTV